MDLMILNLLVAHFVGDFYCQCKRMCDKKIIGCGWFGCSTIFLHSVIIAVLSMLVLWDWDAWKVVLAIFASHYIIDCVKSVISRECNLIIIENGEVKDGKNARYHLWLFLSDQFFHIVAIFVFVYWLGDFSWEASKCISHFISANQMVVKVILACVIICKPANILVQLILKEREVKVTQNDNHGSFRSGALIGIMERCLILAFVILDKYEAIGFLLGAKSILRFSKTQDKPEDEKSEYVLAGTLVSLAIALVMGIMVVKLSF